MDLGKVIREIEVELDEDLLPLKPAKAPVEPAPEPVPAGPTSVPA